MLQVATKIGIHHRFFSGDNFTSKTFKELSLVESFFNIKQDYSAQSRILLNFITDDLLRVFWDSRPENFVKLSEKICSGVPFYLSCTNIVCSLLPDCTAYTLWEWLESKGCSKISRIPKKNLCGSVSFSLTLQPCSPEFLTSAKAGSKKNVFFEYSKIVGSLSEKGLYWSHLIN